VALANSAAAVTWTSLTFVMSLTPGSRSRLRETIVAESATPPGIGP
jgi:hypothetical protein